MRAKLSGPRRPSRAFPPPSLKIAGPAGGLGAFLLAFASRCGKSSSPSLSRSSSAPACRVVRCMTTTVPAASTTTTACRATTATTRAALASAKARARRSRVASQTIAPPTKLAASLAFAPRATATSRASDACGASSAAARVAAGRACARGRLRAAAAKRVAARRRAAVERRRSAAERAEQAERPSPPPPAELP